MRTRLISEYGKGPGEKQTCEREKQVMAEVVTAQFVGWSSCGFATGKYYEIEVSAGRSGCLCVRDVQGQGLCLYSTLENLKRNWRVLDLRETENK